jgi:hypothetical protein
LATAALAGCASILDIDNLTLKSDAGSAGAGGASTGATGNGASAGQSGKAGDRGTGNTGGAAGGELASGGAPAGGDTSVGGSGGASGRGSGGATNSGGAATVGGHGGTGVSGDAGSPQGGAGEGGGGTDQGTTVHGTVIDVWGHLLVGVPVAIGDDVSQTGDDGTFKFENVAPTYTASLVVGAFGWIYQGLTVRQPTLQVLKGFTDTRVVQLDVSAMNVSYDANGSWLLAAGSPNGNDFTLADQQLSNQDRAPWQGPAMNDWTIHGLVVDYTADSLPAAYTAYDSRQEPVTDGDHAHPISLDLHPLTGSASIPSDDVSGTVTTTEPSVRYNYAYVRFASGATMPLVDVESSGSAFSFLLPTLPDGGSNIVAASSGFFDTTGYAVAHEDGVVPGTTDVTIDIPAAAAITLPADGATNVTPNTTFSFEPGQPGIAHLVRIMLSGSAAEIYLLTNKTRFTLSDLDVVNGSMPIGSNQQYTWQVQAHGAPANVDAMCGPKGFIDEFSSDPLGPATLYPDSSTHSFTLSTDSQFTTAP